MERERRADNHYRIHRFPGDAQMNRLHRWYCRSCRWNTTLETEILPWSLGEIELGEDGLEIGPGPGRTTDWLRHRCPSMTCLEVDQNLAVSSSVAQQQLAFLCTVAVQSQCLTVIARFQTSSHFAMLHHVPSVGVARPTLRRGTPGAETGRYLCRCRQLGLVVDEGLSCSRHSHSGRPNGTVQST